MDSVHKAVLRKHRVFLSGELLVSDTIVPVLFQEDILSQDQVEDIESQPTNRLKTLKLLDLLPTRGPRAFQSFMRSLEDFSWVRDRLLLELQNPPGSGPGSTDILQIPDSVLRKVPSDRELSRLALRLGAQWEEVLMDLGLSTEALFRCRADHVLNAHGAALAGLVQWRRSEGKAATVQRLLQSLQAADVHPSVLMEVLT
ncbi:death domain-containing protein CRADD [Echeneis naucrates]|uniref:Death domain-containing protein CRADD-like n=1 Tax=Echeneis naucrates TaxID=173247 RepID=A0A665V837_ECHNA|nr:death domain-containing protein CRADD-like [Echeneis naucrates]XP_029350534.1 death domain-containing protein CRADD-like [Echeneis naucrates]XP_029350535.1 death domain-containing protein CRADD-like [Echeneis naucrates]XP_029350536.1 death domain-containing protein CRADD-like [Echeneis naucrates]